MKKTIGWLLLLAATLLTAYWVFEKTPSSSLNVQHVEHEQSRPLMPSNPTKENTSETKNISDLDEEQLRLAKDYFSQLETSHHLKTDIQSLDDLTEEEKESKVNELMNTVDGLQNDDAISNSEWLFLKLAIMSRYLTRSEFEEYSSQLIAQQKAIVDQRWQNYQNNRSPEFKEYKKREADIIKEIMAMSTYPNGMTRDEYIAFRIEELKKEVY